MSNRIILFLIFILITVTYGYSSGEVRDLSSIEISAYSGESLQVYLLLTDPQGNKTGFDSSINDTVRQIPNSGWGVDDFPGIQPTRFVGIGEPKSGIYTLEVIGINPTTYTVEISIDDIAGNPKTLIFNGVTSSGLISTYTITYDPTPGFIPKVERVITISDTKNDVNISYDLGLIDNPGIRQSLLSKLNAAENAINRGQKKTANNQLNAFIL
ncbi:MAG: hypothetical protein ACOYU0_04130 [Nitrospirota bacterium]